MIAKRLASLPGAESGRGHVWFNTRPNRRYSGGDLLADLPRGRYHTVANDPSGNDAGTLVAELSAYADPFRAGVVMARDLAFPLHLQDFREFVPDAHAKRSVAVSFFFWPDVESPFLAKLPNSARQSLPRVDQGLGWTMSFIGAGRDTKCRRPQAIARSGVANPRVGAKQYHLPHGIAARKNCDVCTNASGLAMARQGRP